MPTRKDLVLWRGNNPTIRLRFKDKATGLERDLAGYIFVMRAVLNGQEIYRHAATPVVGLVSFPWSSVQTRALPLDALAKYEVEARKDGEQVTWLYGTITGQGGINDDVA